MPDKKNIARLSYVGESYVVEVRVLGIRLSINHKDGGIQIHEASGKSISISPLAANSILVTEAP